MNSFVPLSIYHFVVNPRFHKLCIIIFLLCIIVCLLLSIYNVNFNVVIIVVNNLGFTFVCFFLIKLITTQRLFNTHWLH